MMYVRIRKQENREYLVLTTKDRKRVKINLNRLKYKPIHVIQLIYSLPAGQILQLGGSVSIMKNLDGTFTVSDDAKYLAREKEFKKSVKGGDEFRKADSNSIGDFDYSKIIVDPSKLVKGNKYYAGDSVVSLLKKFRNKETQIYSLWYPAEEKYKPYGIHSIRLIHGYVIRKKDGKKMLISGYAKLGDELLYIFFREDRHNYTPEEMLEGFTWEDGEPFGEIENGER